MSCLNMDLLKKIFFIVRNNLIKEFGFYLPNYIKIFLSVLKRGKIIIHADPNREKSIYLDLKEYHERYTYNFIKFFDILNFDIIIKHRYSFIKRFHNYGLYILTIENLSFTLLKGKRKYLKYITDFDYKISAQDHIRLDYNYFMKDFENKSYKWPFPMHPNIYLNYYNYISEDLNSETRKIRIVFAGNYNIASYDEGIEYINGLFKLNNRPEIIKFIIDNYKNNSKLIIFKSLDELLDFNGHVDIAINHINYRLSLKEWQRLLLSSDFLIAPPGVFMPFSHNIIEAMYCGTIPITNYGNFFCPSLTDQIESVQFNTLEELRQSIERVINCDEEQIKEMRMNVRNYYHHNLTPESVKKILSKNEMIDRIMLNVERRSVLIHQRETLN